VKLLRRVSQLCRVVFVVCVLFSGTSAALIGVARPVQALPTPPPGCSYVVVGGNLKLVCIAQ